MKEFKQYKIKAKDLQEKSEIISLLVGLGCKDTNTDDGLLVLWVSLGGKIISVNELDYVSGEQITIEQLREMGMKEYLDKDYILRKVKQTSGDNLVPKDWVEVPKGADAAGDLDGDIEFYKDDFNLYFDKTEMVWSYTTSPQSTLLKWVVWQRESEKKEFLNPFTGQ